MKSGQFLTAVLLLLATTVFAQNTPAGINYQAVARNEKGQILANKIISLEISLYAGQTGSKTAYSEIHRIQTNELGLFTLVVGKGEVRKGDFQQVPWSTMNIWMELAMDETGGKDFKTINASQLMAVPYAFHAGTASELKHSQAEGSEKTAAYWKANGNDQTFPGPHFVGTLDNKDLVFKTSNVERLRITAAGVVTIVGDLAIGNNADVGNNLTVNNNANILKSLSVGEDLTVNGFVRFNNTTQSTTKDNGAVIIEGGVGIEKNVNIGGDLTSTGKLTVNSLSDLNGQVTIDANLGGAQEDYDAYPLRVEGGDHGIAIKIKQTLPDRNANFLTMYDGAGNPMGRIEGFQGLQGVARNIVTDIIGGIPDFGDVIGANDDTDQAPAAVPSSATQFFNSNYGFGALNSTLDFVYSIIQFTVNAVGASGACLSGDCDDVVWSAISMIVNGVKLGGYIAYNEINVGVAFESGGADYAEWLRKANSGELLNFGDVVGVKGGVVSKHFAEAEKFMVISQHPTVIGAMPDEQAADQYEKIAFMGQVPVKVIGVVSQGDYILPSGNGDGMAIAVAPGAMLAKDYSRIIGIAWGESDGKKLFDYVNTAVGINANDMAHLIENLQIVVNQMQVALQQVNPEYKPQFFAVEGTEIAARPAYTTSPTIEQIAMSRFAPSNYADLKAALQPVVQYASEQQLDLGQYPYILDLMNNPGDKALAQKTLDHYTAVLHQLEGMMAAVNKKN